MFFFLPTKTLKKNKSADAPDKNRPAALKDQ